MSRLAPIPENEMQRIVRLSELDLDYSDPNEWLQDLSKLAAKVAGTPISLVNLIDTYTQWTVSNYGLPIDQMCREDSVCQYTITTEEGFEVKDLSKDPRFQEKFYVTGPHGVRYYFGVPLRTKDGFNLGALCVLDHVAKELSPEKIELLRIIAKEIVNRLITVQVVQTLRGKLDGSTETMRKVVHDIRGPLTGIIGLAEIIMEQGDENKITEVLELIALIQKSGTSLLQLADEILTAQTEENDWGTGPATSPGKQEMNLLLFREKLLKLYSPQAISKGVAFDVKTEIDRAGILFSKNKLLQIAGNLISNAIKFTPCDGSVSVHLDLIVQKEENILKILVVDSGVGMTEGEVHAISQGLVPSTEGTKGEAGYGFGLPLVNHLVANLKGSLSITSKPGRGTKAEVLIPIKNNSKG